MSTVKTAEYQVLVKISINKNSHILEIAGNINLFGYFKKWLSVNSKIESMYNLWHRIPCLGVFLTKCTHVTKKHVQVHWRIFCNHTKLATSWMSIHGVNYRTFIQRKIPQQWKGINCSYIQEHEPYSQI